MDRFRKIVARFSGERRLRPTERASHHQQRVEHARFTSRYLNERRDVFVYLPPGYDKEKRTRYPVLYMQDGQNLFEDSKAYLGRSWRLAETADQLIRDGEIEPLIIVGIANAGERRVDEYTPTLDPRHHRGGHAARYGWFLSEELKPEIDARYRTRPEETGIGGSSLGALLSLFLAARYPKRFPIVAALSPSVWWDRTYIIEHFDRLLPKPELKIWLDIGGKEGRGALEHARNLRDKLLEKGWTIGDDLSWTEDEEAGHNEGAWGHRAASMLRFLYGREHANKGPSDADTEKAELSSTR